MLRLRHIQHGLTHPSPFVRKSRNEFFAPVAEKRTNACQRSAGKHLGTQAGTLASAADSCCSHGPDRAPLAISGLTGQCGCARLRKPHRSDQVRPQSSPPAGKATQPVQPFPRVWRSIRTSGALLAGDAVSEALLNRRLAALGHGNRLQRRSYLMGRRAGERLAASNWDRRTVSSDRITAFATIWGALAQGHPIPKFALGTVSRSPPVILPCGTGRPADRPARGWWFGRSRSTFDSLRNANGRRCRGRGVCDRRDGIVLLASNPTGARSRGRAESAGLACAPARDPARDDHAFSAVRKIRKLRARGRPAASRVRMIAKIQPIVPCRLETCICSLTRPPPFRHNCQIGRLAGRAWSGRCLSLQVRRGFILVCASARARGRRVRGADRRLARPLQQANRLARSGR